MKITTYIDGDLLRQALRETGAHSRREAIEMGVRNLLIDVKRQSFVSEFDNLRLGLSLKTLRQRRA